MKTPGVVIHLYQTSECPVSLDREWEGVNTVFPAWSVTPSFPKVCLADTPRLLPLRSLEELSAAAVELRGGCHPAFLEADMTGMRRTGALLL